MNFRLLVLVLVVVFSSCLSARSAEQAGGVFEVKNRSSFAGSGDARNPFWPIGWKKTPGADATAKTMTPEDLKPENFVVSSILLGTVGMPSLAVINGKGYAEGETVAPPSGRSGTIQVVEIHDGTVVLQTNGQRIIVPLRRK